MGMGYRTSEFAGMTGIPAYTLRRLDLGGKLSPLGRSPGGHRYYNESQVEDARQYVKRMKLLPSGTNVIADTGDMDDFFSYLLGLIFADGTVLASGQVQLEMKDKQIVEDVSNALGVKCYPHTGREMWRLTVPRSVSNRLVEYGVCRRKSQGFDIPEMSERSFCSFLRGLFDGDGSVSVRGNSTIVRFHGHPRAMAHIQTTLLGHFGLYLHWVQDNRTNSGMLETSKKVVVDLLRGMMYRYDGICLARKRTTLNGRMPSWEWVN